MPYTIYNADNAPEAAREILAAARTAYGFIPNLLGCMADAPALLKAYTTLARLFDETSFNPAERQVVLLTVSYENRCAYCVAAHSVIAAMQRVPGDVIDAIREGRPIADARLEALRRFTAAVVASRGWPAQEDTRAFFAAGYGPQQVLEMVLGVGIKTLSNQPRALPLISRQSPRLVSQYLFGALRAPRTAMRVRRNGYEILVRSRIAVQSPCRNAAGQGVRQGHLVQGCVGIRCARADHVPALAPHQPLDFGAHSRADT